MDDFLRALASGDPVPGGGSVAALEVAIGAALLSMVSELTLGRKRYASVEEEVLGIRAQSDNMRSRARALVDADSVAYGRVAEAMRLPRDNDDEKEHRRRTIQAALKRAVEPPLSTMQAAQEGMVLATRLAAIGNASAVSDVGTAAHAFLAGYLSAKLNVDINLASIRDEAFVQSIGQEPVLRYDIQSDWRKTGDMVREVIGAPS